MLNIKCIFSTHPKSRILECHHLRDNAKRHMSGSSSVDDTCLRNAVNKVMTVKSTAMLVKHQQVRP